MDETIEKILSNKNQKTQMIRISKIFNKNKYPQNILVIEKGNEKINYNLTQKISKKFILEAIKTIQKNSFYNNDNNNNKNQIFHSSNKFQYQYQSPDKSKLKDKNNDEERNKSYQYLHQLASKDINIIKKDIIPNKNIYNVELTEIGKKNKSKKESKSKIKSFNGLGILENQKSDKQLLKEFNLQENDKNIIDLINTDRNISINDITTQRNKKHVSIRKMIFNNSKNITKLNEDKNINILKISKLTNLQDNNSSLYEKEKINNVINTDFKNNSKNYSKECIICERNFTFFKLYSAKCNIHFFCKDCLKIYYQNLIEKGIRRMKCPVFKCNCDTNKIDLKKILDNNYYIILFGANDHDEDKRTISDEKLNFKSCEISLKHNFKENNNNIELYQNKNVFDINSKFSLSNIKKYEGEYCPKCHEKSLFCLTNSFFNKCLNCLYKCCKYCNKEYTNNHLTLNDPKHCKVFYRKSKYFIENNQSICSNFLLQIIYIIGIYIIFLSYIFLIIIKLFYWLFGIEKEKKKKLNLCPDIIKYFFSYFLCILMYLIILPFLIVMIPFFPSILVLLDGY